MNSICIALHCIAYQCYSTMNAAHQLAARLQLQQQLNQYGGDGNQRGGLQQQQQQQQQPAGGAQNLMGMNNAMGVGNQPLHSHSQHAQHTANAHGVQHTQHGMGGSLQQQQQQQLQDHRIEEEEADGGPYEYEDEGDNRREHKRRFAFVNNFSNAKMQHECAGREKEGERSKDERNSRGAAAHRQRSTTATSAAEQENDQGACPQLKQSKLSAVVALEKNTTSTATTRTKTSRNEKENSPEEQAPPRKKIRQMTKRGEDETNQEGFSSPHISMQDATTRSRTKTVEEEQTPSSTLLPVDRISDSERRKWNEIQSKFSRDDDDDNGHEPANLSRSASLGGSRTTNTAAAAPVTPEDEFATPGTLSSSELAAGIRSASAGKHSSRVPSSSTRPRLGMNFLQQFAHQATDESSPSKTEISIHSKYQQIGRSSFLQQFAHQADDGSNISANETATATATATSRNVHQRRTKSALPSVNESEASSVDDKTSHGEVHGKNPNAITCRGGELRTCTKRTERDETESISLPKDYPETKNSNLCSTEPEYSNPKEDCASTTNNNAFADGATEVQVVWESYFSTEDVCSKARAERLNMHKRKQEIHDIRRLVKSKSQERSEFGQPDIDTKTGEIKNGVKSDDEQRDIGDGDSSSSPFIRISKSTFRSGMEVIGQFNLGFILARCPRNHLWIMDQHACDEKYNFEQLCKKTVMHVQPLIRPLPVELNPSEEACVLDHMDIFASNGFKFKFDKEAPIRHRLSLTSLPHSGAHEGRKAVGFGPSDVSALCAILTEGSCYEAGSGGTGTDGTGMYGNNAVRRYAGSSTNMENADRLLARLPKAIAMFASRACRTSIMIGTALSQKEMTTIVQKLSRTDMPWNCPHGRPTMRHVANILPVLLKDEHRAAEHIAIPTISVVPATQHDE
uniref:MutL C-terminal dimerisation domain-containing protein n=1 Tax=Pseudo-nitzschia australis TaxID=44445 RepID=A0A6V0BI65_9STRA